ncbi:unnamed protein product [Blepharisma stoltei]|uniref:ATP-dependent RNA helicase n=1 Tax=Blepharisma stoltei TaxID=1481888 RepID=A0AAU9IJA8_9CILI|nr:unnamed protein product [Blepharisma stoltei]
MVSNKLSSKKAKSQKDETKHKKAAKATDKKKSQKQKTRSSKQNKEIKTINDVPINDFIKERIIQLSSNDLSEKKAQLISSAIKSLDIMAGFKNEPNLSTFIVELGTILLDKSGSTNGTSIIILTNNRESAIQYGETANEILDSTNYSRGVIAEGTNTKGESKKLEKSINLLIATPQRLLYHLSNTSDFNYQELKAIIIDDANAFLSSGLADSISQIEKFLPKSTQKIVFSDTRLNPQNSILNLNNQIEIGFENSPDTEQSGQAIQGYVIVKPDQRLNLLYSFLRKHQDKKILVFFNSSNSVKFHNDLFSHFGLSVNSLYGKQKLQDREEIYKLFCDAELGTLLSTDVLFKGLQIPDCDWIIQYEQPNSAEDYAIKIENAVRANKEGKGLIFLQPHENGFTRFLKNNFEFQYTQNKLTNIQAETQRVIGKNYDLHRFAREAHRDYVLAYHSNHLQEVFNFDSLDLAKIALSFGFETPPRVNIYDKKNEQENSKRAQKFMEKDILNNEEEQADENSMEE